MLPDISDLYAYYLDQQSEPEIPDWAPRSCLKLRSQAEENYITRIEKRLCRKLDYGETWALISRYRADGPETRPFIKRHYEDIIPF